MSIQKSLMPVNKRIFPIKGAWYSSELNETILDLSGQTLNLSLGQPPEEIRQSIKNEIDKNIFFSSRFGSETSENLAIKLLELAPDNITGINHKLSNGSDAVETALKIGFENVRSSTVIALPGAWHGETMATLSLSSKVRSKYIKANMNVVFSNEATIESLIQKSLDITRPSVVIIDPIGFSTGLFGFDNMKKYLPRLRSSCLKMGHFLVFDEIQCFGGFLEGEFFSYDLFKVECDAIAIGKALGQGFAVSACLYDKDASELLYNEAEFTHGAQPPACAAALAGIRYVESLKEQIKDSYKMWELFVDYIEKSLGDQCEFKRVGFTCSITPSKSNMVEILFQHLLTNGLITRKGNGSKSLILKAPILFDKEMFSWAQKAINTYIDSTHKYDLVKFISINNNENVNFSYAEELLNKIMNVDPFIRSQKEQQNLSFAMGELGVPCLKIIKSNDLYSYPHIEGVSLDKYNITSKKEAKSILSQIIDYIMKCHDNDIIIGDRWQGNTIWNGDNITFIDLDIGYVGENSSLKVFEHLFALFHHATIIPDSVGRFDILKPYLFEFKHLHSTCNVEEIFCKFQLFYNNSHKTINPTSMSVDIYKNILLEFSSIIIN